MNITVTEIESAIEKLPLDEVSKLSRWFEEFEARIWEKKIESDLQSGKLKELLAETEKDFTEGNCQSL